MGIWIGFKEVVIGITASLILLSPKFIDHISRYEDIKKWNNYDKATQAKRKVLKEEYEKVDL